MKKIQILMSTYNGKKYIKEQIDSILEQNCERFELAELHLLVRDDGSTDGTQEILEEYAKEYPQKIRWYQGANKGVINSFFDLVVAADDDADYYALADQDDYWEIEKMSKGIECLEKMPQDGRPHLYCCRPKLVDEQLHALTSEIKRPPMRPNFSNALVENIVTGCTIVMDKTLQEMVKADCPRYTVMHDWWFYLVVSCFGQMYYDETPYICYRQHGGNTVGTNVSKWKELKDRVKRFKGNRQNISNQMSEFLRVYSSRIENLTQDDVKNASVEKDKIRVVGDGQTDIVGRLAYGTWSVPVNAEAKEYMELAKALVDSRSSFASRIRLVRSGKVYRQRKNDDRIFKFILLSGSF